MTLPQSYFDRLYAANSDPWSLSVRWYEKRKYQLTLAALDRPWYGSGLEVGCSVGVLTAGLADRCGQLLSLDVAESAVQTTMARMSTYPHVRVEQRHVPTNWPAGRFDLVVLSEVLYYLGDEDLDTTVSRAVGCLRSGGTLLAVHWRHPVAEYPQGGDAVHHRLRKSAGLVRTVSHAEPDLLLDVFVRAADDADPATLAPAWREGLS